MNYLKYLNSSPVKRATVNSVQVAVIAQMMIALSGIMVARLLGAENRGYLALLALIPWLLSTYGNVGLPQAITHYLSTSKVDYQLVRANILKYFLIQSVLVSLVYAGMILLFTRQENAELVLSCWITLIVIPGFLAQQYGFAILQGLHEFTKFNRLRLLSIALYTLYVVMVFIFGAGSLFTIAAGWSVIQLFSGLLIFYLAFTEVLKLKNDINSEWNAKKLLQYGVKGLVGYSSLIDNVKIDQLIAGIFLSPVALGYYVVAQAFSNLPKLIPQSISMIAFPVISRMIDKNMQRRVTYRFAGYSIALTSILVVFLILTMPYLVDILFGAEFAESVILGQILLVGMLFYSVRKVLVEGARGMGAPYVSTKIELLSYPVFILLAAILITFYGIVGLAIALTLNYFITMIMSIVMYKNFAS